MCLVALCGIFFFTKAQAQGVSLDLTVQGVDNSVSPSTLAPVTDYRWMIQEDLTYHNDPNVPVPDINPDALGLNFSKSYMPLVAKGKVEGGLGQLPGSAALEPDKHYFISVLPNESESYALGGTSFSTFNTVGGQVSATVYLNKLPLPTAQIRVFVFEDNQPINNAPDLPEEQGLEGFTVLLEEPAGRYGASGGPVFKDVYGNPLGTEYDADGNITKLGDGVIRTNANGIAVVKNLAPAKYGVKINPPDSSWIQTSTIEGTRVIDAWVKANEPPYFMEFGPPGPHVSFGFVKEFNNLGGGGGATISGQVINTHMSRPPDYTFYLGAVFPDAYVGLNDMSVGRGLGVYAGLTYGNSEFSIPNVPPGTYQLVIWDKNLDIIFASARIIVTAENGAFGCDTPDGGCNLGQVGVFDWFGHLRGKVFLDTDRDGFQDSNERGIPSTVNLRWRDGTIYQTAATGNTGEYAFEEVFPFFDWLVAEVDFAAPYKATGMTAVVDAGGEVLPHAGWSWPSYDRLNPQQQAEINPNTGNNLSRTEKGEVLTQGFQLFLGQTNIIDWGKTIYDTSQGESGGISGMVVYKTTRAEPNPEDDIAQNWEPGIPRVQVNLYRDCNGDGLIDVPDRTPGSTACSSLGSAASFTLADVDNHPFGWAEGGAKGLEDIDRNGNGAFDLGDALAYTHTDSWDDNQPEGCPGDSVNDPFYLDGKCYDGLRNFNQVRPAVFDGGYAFPGYDAVTNPEGIKPGIYIVEAVPPPNYEIVRAQDMNVAFGETYMPSALDFAFVPTCVGEEYEVPAELSLFPGVLHPFKDPESSIYKGTGPVFLNACDRKQVQLAAGANAAADFFAFTEVPIAALVNGFILNDLANEFDPLNPNFGEKHALPFVPVSFRDWTGREITRVYSDQYGNYNALLPSTFTANIPFPSGMSPIMVLACMNDAGPVLDPDTGQMVTDPQFKPQYTQYCYTFEYMPGVTTYLDTPVEPIAAFAGQDQFPLDCQFKDGTPVIRSAKGQGHVGPYVDRAGQTVTLRAMGLAPVTNPDGGGIIFRDYGFGNPTAGVTVTLDGQAVAERFVAWGADSNELIVTIPPSTGRGSHQLMVTRGDTGLSTIVGITVTVGPLGAGRSVIEVAGPAQWPSTPLQNAIDSAAPGDLVLVGEGTYEELVVMWKPIQLQGAGALSTVISGVKTPTEKLQLWRDKVAGLFANGSVDPLPGQQVTADPAAIEPGLLGTAEAPGIMVIAKNATSLGNGGFVEDPNARIDGLTVQGSDIGGGIFVNGYARFLEISNNLVKNNAGLNGGGIIAGVPDLLGADEVPVSAENSSLYIHHNHITMNGSRETAAGGGVSLYTGADNYVVSDCYICGNFSKGAGGGIGHQGLSDNGQIVRNKIIFNQTFNQLPGTAPPGGGISIEGFAPVAGLTPGAGSVTIDGNLIQGNLAGAGDGGGIELAMVNGQDVSENPNDPDAWYQILVSDNMIVNNVAGVAAGGVSLRDAANVKILNNTIAHNDSTATQGDLVRKTPDPQTGGLSDPQPAGVVARRNSDGLVAAFGPGYVQTFSDPVLANNIVWENRSFFWALDDVGNGILLPSADTYWDLAVLDIAGSLTCQACVLTGSDPAFVSAYFNNNGSLSTIPEDQTPLTSAAVDEGGNFIDVRFGPLTLWDPATGALYGDYHIQAGSVAIDAGADFVNTNAGRLRILSIDELQADIDGDRRLPRRIDIGADELN